MKRTASGSPNIYKQALDGKVFKLGGTQMSRGEYETITIEAADPPAVLAEIGSRIDVLNFREAIGLGVVKDGLPFDGRHHHQERYTRGVQANPRATSDRHPAGAVAFRLAVDGALGLLLFDGDEKDNLREILTALYPGFAEVAAPGQAVGVGLGEGSRDRRTAEGGRASVRAARRAGQGQGLP